MGQGERPTDLETSRPANKAAVSKSVTRDISVVCRLGDMKVNRSTGLFGLTRATGKGQHMALSALPMRQGAEWHWRMQMVGEVFKQGLVEMNVSSDVYVFRSIFLPNRNIYDKSFPLLSLLSTTSELLIGDTC